MNASEASFPIPSPDQQCAFSHKHGLGQQWVPIASKGIVHSVYRVQDVVVKIPRDHPEWVSDTLTEAVALPPAHAAGVPTAPLIAFDVDRDVFDVPVLVIGYVDGRSIDPVSQDCPTCHLLGRALHLLHKGVKVVDDPHGWLDETASEGAVDHFRQAMDRNSLSVCEAQFVESVLESTSTEGCHPAVPAFVHNDVHEGNVLYSDDGSVWLIDWGDAAWGDPAHDFTRVPPEWLLRVLKGYGSDGEVTKQLTERIALNQVGNALRNVANSTVWAGESRQRLRRFSRVCGELLDTDIAPITA